MADVLKKICADKLDHIAHCKREHPLAQVEASARMQSPVRGFAAALSRTVANGGLGLIAEIKKASPSKGLIREDFDPPALARDYATGGATCLSVLTDRPYFQGEDSYLSAAREAVSLPVLRKDFMLDPYQIAEARALGADCVLLIMAALDDTQAAELAACATEWSMDVLVEVHDAAEMERAFALKDTLLGINNRNLKTLEVSLDTCRELAALAPGDRLLVGESGLGSHDDLLDLASHGIHCFLVGESLMRQDDIVKATKTLLGINDG